MTGGVRRWPRTQTIESLRARTIETADGCWLWTGYVMPNGYANCKHEDRNWYVHRLMNTLADGEILGGLVVDHECHNRDHRACHNERMRRGRALEGIEDGKAQADTGVEA